MKSLVLASCLLALSTPLLAAEPVYDTIHDSAGYEASLRRAGVPLSGGLAWPVRVAHPAPAAAATAPASATPPAGGRKAG